jgi:hypothetical protein
MKVKYPRTYHLPFSEGRGSDDKVIATLDYLRGREVIVTEKMDGENSTLYTNHYHARSLDSKHHESRDWLKKFHGEISYKIPENLRICGENLYAQHSIAYDDLLSYFYGFSVWDERNVSLSVEETDMWFEELGIVQPQIFYRGTFDVKVAIDLANSLDTEKHEGFVVRVVDEIPYDDFDKLVAKWVRPAHVQTDEHWMRKAVVPNKLRG